MNRVLVTGGSGELGSSLVPRLRKAGYTVRIMSRRPAPPDLADGVEWATADLATGVGLTEAVAGVTEIIHAASQPFKQTMAIDVEGTARLTQAAKEAGVEHFFYVSIVGVDRIPISYYKHKVAAEKIVEASGLNWSILRAVQFHSFVDTLTASLARLPIMFVPTDFYFQPMETGEVADHIVDGLQRGLRGRWADLAGPQRMRWGELAHHWLAARGEVRRIVRLPIPGRFAAALRAGYNTVPDRPSGTITWEAWLSRKGKSENVGGLD